MQSVKLGFKYAMQTWGYHLVAMLLGVFFISTMSGVLGMIINLLLIVGIVGVSLNAGAYQGEKASTAAANIRKHEKEGRRVSELQRGAVYKKSVAAWIMIFGCLPFLLLSGANLMEAAKLSEAAVVEQSAEGQTDSDIADSENEQTGVTAPPVNAAARIVFSGYISFYSLVSGTVLNYLFFVFSLPIAAAMAIGYLCGPRLRNKKLYDIVKGKKRKQRNLKVNKNDRRNKPVV